MNEFTICIILALCVSADALACGFSAGASRLKVPMISACAAGVMSAAFVAVGMSAGNVCGRFVPPAVQKYLSFALLAVFGFLKLLSGDGNSQKADCNSDKRLSVPEGVALGSALSVDGLAAGFSNAAPLYCTVCTAVCTFAFTAAALYFGAKGGQGVKSARLGNVSAGLALVVLAAEKLL